MFFQFSFSSLLCLFPQLPPSLYFGIYYIGQFPRTSHDLGPPVLISEGGSQKLTGNALCGGGVGCQEGPTARGALLQTDEDAK